MSVKEHPDYKEEAQKLEHTKEAIKNTLEAIEKNRQVYKEGIRQAFEDLDYLDSSQSYISILTNTKFLELDEKSQNKLLKTKDKPYFGRIDFKNKGSKETEKIYLGKTSLYRDSDNKPLIVDWRAPIANVYYEGRLGAVSYQGAKENINGELKLKRQYTIEDGELENILDIDITTTDEFLQASLDAKADSRLKDIASTIQAEQNKIIRADIEQPLIVQGVAGSGKTTIALHRIAYLIYTYQDNFIPENFMIIAPNSLFLNYISEVLPELGVERVRQTTFIDFAFELIGKKYKLINPDEKLLYFINEAEGSGESLVKWTADFKGSLQFKEIVNSYIEDLIQNFVPREDFSLEGHVIVNNEYINNLFANEYKFLPVYKRIDAVKKILSHKLKTAKVDILDDIKADYEQQIDEARRTLPEGEERRQKIVSLMDDREEKLNAVTKSAKTIVNKFIKKFPKEDLFFYYQDIITVKDNLAQYSAGQLTNEQIDYLSDTVGNLLAGKKIELEDFAGLIYLKHRLFGFTADLDVNTVIIDEAQDFSVFQIYILKEILDTKKFTILGDLSQGIHSYRGINDWQDVIDQDFNGNCNYLTLQQSYRTTIEVMDLANQVIKKLNNPGTIIAKPVIRHGEKPSLTKCSSATDLIPQLKEQLHGLANQNYKSFALICKNMDECKKVKKQLEKDKSLEISLLSGAEDSYQGGIMILPSHVAKGLEFDVVFIITSESSYTTSELDIKLLYVAMTRALHRLNILQVGDSIPMLNDVGEEYLTKKSAN